MNRLCCAFAAALLSFAPLAMADELANLLIDGQGWEITSASLQPDLD